MSPLETIERWYELVWNRGERNAVAELFASDGTVSGVGPEPVRGPEGFLPVYEAWREAFCDYKFVIQKGFENGEWASVQVKGEFTHRASGRRLSAEGMVMARVVEDRIVEAHNGFDYGAILERAGIFPGGSLVSVLNNRMVFTEVDRRARNKEIVRELVSSVFNGKQFDRVPEFYHQDCEGYDPALPEPMTGIQTIYNVLETYESGFPGYQYQIEDLIAEGDKVALRFVITAEHSRPFRSVPPSGKALTITGSAIVELDDGKIRRLWQQWDDLGFATQLGILERPSLM